MPLTWLIVNRKSSTVKKVLFSAIFLLLATTLAGCTALGSAAPSALQITSTPQASVFLDGKHVGKSPFFSDQLKNQEYTVKITSGEASHIEKVTLEPGTLTVINWELNNNFLAQSGEILSLEPGNKGIFVVTMPGEATLELDGKLIGKTPVKIDDIEEGEHKLLISKDGYIEREFAVKTSNSYRLQAEVTLASEIAKGTSPAAASPAPQTNQVEVISTPLGFLRVRSEASLTSAEIGRVETGDKLELIQETQDWVKVKFEDKQGWVSAQYVQKVP